MSEEYEYEVMRAELLGLPPPEQKPLPSDSKPRVDEDDDIDAVTLENDKEEEIQSEEMGRVSGGLDELNSILSVTQKKINRFKTVCGSFTNLLKLKVGVARQDGGASDCSSQASEGEETPADANEGGASDAAEGSDEIRTTSTRNLELEGKLTSRELDLEGKLTRDIDKLDSILLKSEQAEISMTKQKKEMRGFLK